MNGPRHAKPAEVSRRRLLTGGAASVGGALLAGVTGPALLGRSDAFAADQPDPTGAFKAGSATGPTNGSSRKSRKAMGRGDLRNAGAGMHSGPDTAMGLSTFTLNPRSVTCGVGSLGNSPGAVPMTAQAPTGLATTGPFAMLMYATDVSKYQVSVAEHSITARGTMRSITLMANQTVEDVLHQFIAIGIDHRGEQPDEFYLHFFTPFWNAANPMATKSTLQDTWAMFGAAVLLGEVNAG